MSETKRIEESGYYDLRIPLGGGSLKDKIAVAIRDCFHRNSGKLDKTIMDNTIKAVGKRTPQYKTEWKDFKKTFNIEVQEGKYVNPYFIQ